MKKILVFASLFVFAIAVSAQTPVQNKPAAPKTPAAKPAAGNASTSPQQETATLQEAPAPAAKPETKKEEGCDSKKEEKSCQPQKGKKSCCSSKKSS
ncbi:MAG: hypothetical protein MUC81_00215 [Bacteroidia bacterium]|jgi:hypothetical protein|nr:hypothetical protein [Bacteroidia bacterium]